MKYDIPQRVFLVKKYYESKSITSVQRNFRTKYPKEDSPSHRTILNIVSNLKNMGRSHMCLLNEKIQIKNERRPKISSKNWYQKFLICPSGKQHARSKFHQHLCTTFFTMTCISNLISFIYGTNWRTKTTKKD